MLAVTALQRAVPSDQLARVFGVFFAFVLSAIALGTVITPAVVSALGLNGALLDHGARRRRCWRLLGYPALLAIDRQTAGRCADALAPRVALLEKLGIFATACAAGARAPAEGRDRGELRAGHRDRARGRTGRRPVRAASRARSRSAPGRGEAGGPERRLRTLTAPAYFGEIGVLGRIPRTATVTALTDCRCERIEGDALLDALTASPPSSALMETASSRWR